MIGLMATLDNVASRIKQYAGKAIGEQNTKQVLIVPVLRALGWDIEDLEEVRLEYKLKPGHNPVDYALLLTRTPRLFVEAKGLGENLQDQKWAGQIMGYASVAGVEWVVLTDGDEWRIYNSHAAVPVEEKLFRSVRVSGDLHDAAQTLALLSKSQTSDKVIDGEWKSHFVDRQVERSLRTLFTSLDPGLVKLVRKQVPSLLPAEIRASIARLRLSLDFPAQVSVVEPQAGSSPPKLEILSASTPSADSQKGPLGTSSPWGGIRLTELLAAGVIRPGAALVISWKSKQLTATLRSDGQIECLGRTYTSPSAAALDSVRSLGATWKTVNGWEHWRTARPDGTLAVLNALRRELYERNSGVGAAWS